MLFTTMIYLSDTIQFVPSQAHDAFNKNIMPNHLGEIRSLEHWKLWINAVLHWWHNLQRQDRVKDLMQQKARGWVNKKWNSPGTVLRHPGTTYSHLFSFRKNNATQMLQVLAHTLLRRYHPSVGANCSV